MQNDYVGIFAQDLVKLESPNEAIVDRYDKADSHVIATRFYAYDMETMMVDTAEFRVEIPFSSPLKV